MADPIDRAEYRVIEALRSVEQEKRTKKRTETHACDLIDRRALMKEFSDFVRTSNNSDYARTPTWNDAVSLVGSMPSAQPEIIRCRDCIAYQEGIDIDGKPFTRCNGINGSVRTYGHTLPDWYCADAERRTDE